MTTNGLDGGVSDSPYFNSIQKNEGDGEQRHQAFRRSYTRLQRGCDRW